MLANICCLFLCVLEYFIPMSRFLFFFALFLIVAANIFLYHVTESFLYRQKNNTVAKLHFGSILMAFYILNSFPLLDILLQVRLQVFTRISASFDRHLLLKVGERCGSDRRIGL